ncbi:hypothetical protein [Comamonas odontotermitis]|uniref:hypothetical protein n=1 Tax=Comamonas odontotermitis TaxID=379895 RepID=UPI001CC59931|nr:hypothetical protein [Comamonas odontotermitis]UBB19518.1 hypothetical protein LAD35_22195 [Comamonas odontotermitis]
MSEKRKTSLLTWCIAGVFAIAAVSCIFGESKSKDARDQAAATLAASESAKSPEQKSQEAAAKAKTEAEFQSVRRIVTAIKESSKNPKSFDLVQALYLDSKVTCVVYRGTNSFNATVTESMAVDSSGSKVDWNKNCANKNGTDYTYVRQVL